MEENIYEKKSVNPLIIYFSLPAIFSLIVEIMASVVDTVFAGHLGSISVDALSTMGLISPILSIYTALQALFSVSTAILIAKNLNNKERRIEYFSIGFGMSVLTSVAISIVSYFSMERILFIIGASGNVRELAKIYLKVQLFSNVFSSMGYTLTSCIRAYGYPKIEMWITSSAVLSNIVFNSVLVFIFDRGFLGLAYGTLISEILCTIVAIVWLIRHKLFNVKIIFCKKELFEKSSELFRLGIAQTIIQSLAGCSAFFINKSLIINTSADYVAIWNVVQKIYTLFLMPIVGITQGVQTIIAYFNGENKNYKNRKVIIITLKYAIGYGLLTLLITYLFGKNILNVFIKAEDLNITGNNILHIVFSTFPLMGIFYTITTILEVTGNEIRAVILILARQVFFIIPLVFVIPKILSEYSFAIFFAVPLVDILAILISIKYYIKYRNV